MRKDNLQYANCRSAICELFFATRILFSRLFHIQIDVYDFYIVSCPSYQIRIYYPLNTYKARLFSIINYG